MVRRRPTEGYRSATPRGKGPPKPHARLERSLGERGSYRVAGLDEVGRGAWAGPASVGVAVFNPRRRPPPGLRDSKLLTEPRRESLFPLVTGWCTEWAVGHVEPGECDRLGMTAALRLAAWRAIDALTEPPEVLLVDGNFDYVSPPGLTGEDDRHECRDGPRSDALDRLRVHTVIRGDATCVSVAAASIVAKVTRDRMMREMASNFPAFDFEQNKGYPSPVHRTALAGHGLTSVHRRSWSYVDDLAFR